MPNKQPSYRLTGNNPLAYMGVEPYTPPQLETHSYNPTINDNNFNIGTIWTTRNPAPITIWMLADQSNPLPGNAKWVQLYPNSGGSIEFVGNLGSATASAGILNVPGTSVIATSGSGNTLTIEMTNGSDGQVIIGGGAAPAWANITAGSGITITNGANSIQIASSSGQGVDSVPCDTGSAAPVAGVLNIYGSNLINTNGSGNTVTVALNKANNGYIPIGSTGNPTVMAPITAGSGITVTNASNSITIATTAVRTIPTDSGTATPVAGALTIAGANLINTSASGSTVTVALNKSNDGQIPIGATAAATVMANITSMDGSITVTNGPNTIDLSTLASSGGAIKLTKFNSSGTWTKASNAQNVTVILWGGGCGGGSGSRFSSSGNGGGGGCGGGTVYYTAPASLFSATETVTIGAGGAGGVSAIVDNSPGSSGSVGGYSSIGNITTCAYSIYNAGQYGAFAVGGLQTNNGLGAQNLSNNATVGLFPVQTIINLGTSYPITIAGSVLGGGGWGGYGSGAILRNGSSPSTDTYTTNAPKAVSIPIVPSGGGGGAFAYNGGISTSGGNGGSVFTFNQLTTIVSGGTGGIATGTINGGNGNNAVNSHGLITGGTGGGGGGGPLGGGANPVGSGGNGGIPGGGGGGGSGSLNGINSGAGGSGAQGAVWVIEQLGA